MSTGNIGKIKASRVNNVPNVESYIGEKGILFYNYANGVIRMSDGITPGGIPVPYTVASATTVGGIKAGPGANISVDGTLTIDTGGLPLSIGNLDIYDTTISTVNPDVDLNLIANGEGQINLVGNVHIHTTAGGLNSDPIVDVNDEGQVKIRVPDSLMSGAVQVIGTQTGTVVAPGLPGAMLHVTGQIDTDCRMYYDGNGGYVAVNHRAWNGNISTGLQSIKAGDDVLRLNATAATTSGMGNVAFAQIRYTATEDQTPTAQGSNISFWTTAIGTSATNRVQVANISVANGVNATKFTTAGAVAAGSINVTGNLVAGNVIANTVGTLTGNVSGTVLTAAQPNITSVGTLTSLSVSGNINANGVTVTGNITAGNIDVTGTVSGHYTHALRNAGVIADGGTITLDFTTDDIVKCIWGNGMTVNYANLIPGRSVRLIATKATGTGTDSLSLDGISANNTSTGSNSISGAADVTYIIEFYSTNTSVAGLYAKI